ncbi:unnamed protein product [Vitrella brassicaformis CCMP3155]|uniref:Palmitoyltransferase n=1 Tax=Vitrella brassicaformis (strain CCMP3155) TaxID=1169540 RepID=A0A0G4GXX4_VITBC|nr:unnamed protein product [Vitrella brassicaformis CCMP3155]|eukprot:CEM35719.1 unnamed protein product [Vitrella brassicaformis CCMP3155]
MRGNVRQVQWAIARGAYMGARDFLGRTALHLAVKNGVDEEVITTLVRYGGVMLTNDKDVRGVSPYLISRSTACCLPLNLKRWHYNHRVFNRPLIFTNQFAWIYVWLQAFSFLVFALASTDVRLNEGHDGVLAMFAAWALMWLVVQVLWVLAYTSDPGFADEIEIRKQFHLMTGRSWADDVRLLEQNPRLLITPHDLGPNEKSLQHTEINLHSLTLRCAEDLMTNATSGHSQPKPTTTTTITSSRVGRDDDAIYTPLLPPEPDPSPSHWPDDTDTTTWGWGSLGFSSDASPREQQPAAGHLAFLTPDEDMDMDNGNQHTQVERQVQVEAQVEGEGEEEGEGEGEEEADTEQDSQDHHEQDQDEEHEQQEDDQADDEEDGFEQPLSPVGVVVQQPIPPVTSSLGGNTDTDNVPDGSFYELSADKQQQIRDIEGRMRWLMAGVSSERRQRLIAQGRGEYLNNILTGKLKGIMLIPQSVKTPRVHYCKEVGRTIRRFDHFCPWVDNAVGVGNQRVFFTFIFFCWLGIVLTYPAVWLYYTHIVMHADTPWFEPAEWRCQLLAFVCGVDLVWVWFVSQLCLRNFRLLLTNLTAWEIYSRPAHVKKRFSRFKGEATGCMWECKDFTPARAIQRVRGFWRRDMDVADPEDFRGDEPGTPRGIVVGLREARCYTRLGRVELAQVMMPLGDDEESTQDIGGGGSSPSDSPLPSWGRL